MRKELLAPSSALSHPSLYESGPERNLGRSWSSSSTFRTLESHRMSRSQFIPLHLPLIRLIRERWRGSSAERKKRGRKKKSIFFFQLLLSSSLLCGFVKLPIITSALSVLSRIPPSRWFDLESSARWWVGSTKEIYIRNCRARHPFAITRGEKLRFLSRLKLSSTTTHSRRLDGTSAKQRVFRLRRHLTAT